MSAWPRERLSRLGAVTTGSTPSTSQQIFYGGNIPFVTPAELDQDGPITTAARTLSEDGGAQARLLPEGAVMVCCIGSLGKVGIAGTKVATNQQINSVVFDPKRVWPRFGFYACRLLKPKLETMAPATTVAIVSKSKFEELEIPLPPVSEQRRIAAILDKAAELRAKRRAALAQLDTASQALFQDLFGDHTTILTKWPVKKLGEILDFLTSGSRGWAAHYADSGALFLRIQNVRHDRLLLEDIAYVNAPDTAEAKRTRVVPGDVLLSITADLGRTAVIPEGIGTAFINQHLSILRTKALAPQFLSAYLASPVGQRQVSGRNRQAVKAGLNFDDIRSFIVPVPPIHLQKEFVRRVAAIEKLKTAHRASLLEMDALFASVQHRAFRGEL
jgi:type I restriction enzyme S subunit